MSVREELVTCMWVAAQREKSGLESPVLMAPGEVGCSRRRLDECPTAGWVSLRRPLAVPHQLSCVSVSFRSISVQEIGLQQMGLFCPFPQSGPGWAKSDVMRVGTRHWGWLLLCFLLPPWGHRSAALDEQAA